MKKTISILMLGIALMLASCSQDDSVDLQNSENNRVMISANLGDEAETLLKSGAQTRATGDLQLTGYSLRYILEVWNKDNNIVTYREEKLVDDASQTVTFDFRLPYAGDYDALLWADYIADDAAESQEVIHGLWYTHYKDLHYKTVASTGVNGLKEVMYTGSSYAVNTASRDAFFGKSSFKKVDGMSANAGRVTLKRPFGRINIIEKNATLLAELTSMSLAYNAPMEFNVMDGEPIEEHRVIIRVDNLTSFPDAATDKANLFFDYIFAPSSGQGLLPEIRIDYTLVNDVTGTFTIPANVPVERNKRTNVSGKMLADPNMAGLSVVIDDVWDTPDVLLATVGDYYYEGGEFSDTYNSSLNCLGIVFYTENGGQNGKVVGLQERSAVGWGESITTNATDMSNGLTNMATIYALSNDFTGYPAFKWIHDDMNGGGTTNYYSDATAKGVWYLPAQDELLALHAAYHADRTTFNDKLTTAGGTALGGGDYFYWSSSEYDENNAWSVYSPVSSVGPSVGSIQKSVDDDDRRARCILAF